MRTEGQRARVRPKSIQMREALGVKKPPQTHKEKQHKAVREGADFNRLLHFIKTALERYD